MKINNLKSFTIYESGYESDKITFAIKLWKYYRSTKMECYGGRFTEH
jgi:hypothetical protein